MTARFDPKHEDTWPVLKLFEPPAPLSFSVPVGSLMDPGVPADMMHAVLQCAPDGIVVLEPEMGGPARVAFVNEAFCRMTRLTRQQAMAAPRLLGSAEADRALLEALEHPQWRQGFAAEGTAKRSDGSLFVLDIVVIPVADPFGLPRCWVAFLRDVSERKARLATLEHQLLHDLLTHLPNRDLLKDRLKQALLARTEDNAVGLLTFDLNAFREVNESFGATFGDEVLRQVATRVTPALSSRDTLARLDGDRFAVLLPQIIDIRDAVKVAQHIYGAFAAPFDIEGQMLDVGVSVGVAVAPTHATTADGLMRCAEVAMYAAKTSRNGYLPYAAEQETVSPGSLTLRVDLREAIGADQLVLHFQPELHLQTNRVSWVECLVRWQHPARGLLRPDQFIGMAERSALIKPLTEWVLDRALSTCRTWRDAGVNLGVAVNLPTQSLLEPFLPQRIFKTLDKWGLDSSVLKLEITESGIMADPPHVLAILHLLRTLGVRLSLDDFGTGFSSLSHMRNLPIDEIKIDRSFIVGMLNNDSDAAIVRAVIQLAHSLEHEVVAEGVADEPTLRALGELGCDHVQGFHLSRPLPASQLLKWLAESPYSGPVDARVPRPH
jgi:diguanylate cyclase (GGDEF)-like protein